MKIYNTITPKINSLEFKSNEHAINPQSAKTASDIGVK